MKIKTKKQLNLPQLIEWAWDNPEQSKHKIFRVCGREPFDGASFNNDENGVRLSGTVMPTDLFTVEVEEEVTEDTEFEKLYYTTILSRIVESSCTTIQSSLKHIAVEPIAFYILNDDLTMTLIWRDGKLVD